MFNVCKTLLSLVIVVSCANACNDQIVNKCSLTNCGCADTSCNNNVSMQIRALDLNAQDYYGCVGGSCCDNGNIQNNEFYKLKQQNNREKNSEYKKQFSNHSKIDRKNNVTKITLTKNYKQPVKNQY